jgi:hypothetical protein
MRANKGYLARFANFGKIRVLGEKTIPGMYSVGIRDFCSGNYASRVEITLAWRRVAYTHLFIGEPYMEGIDIGLGINRNGFHSEFLAGPDYPKRYFSPIGDQYLFKQAGPLTSFSN